MTTTIKTPAYVRVAAQIREFAAANSIPLVPQSTELDGFAGNKNWACFQIAGTEHKVYVPRSADKTGPLHTTVLVPAGTPGLVPHTRERDGRDMRPGKIEAFFSPEPETLGNLLRLWAGTTDRLRAAKAPTRRADSQADTTPAATPAAGLHSLSGLEA